MQRSVIWLSVSLLFGCGAAVHEGTRGEGRSEEVHGEVVAPEAPEANAAPEVHREAEEGREAVVAAARFEVAAPSDLGAAIAARLPTIELVPQRTCGAYVVGTLSFAGERVCLVDPATGLVRAMRRFATSNQPVVHATRNGDEVIFGVMDPGDIATRYDGRVWRWELGTDRYTGLIGSADLGYSLDITDADFGVLIRGEERLWVYAAGTLEQLRWNDDLRPWSMARAGDATYQTRLTAGRDTVERVRREGPRLVVERIARYPSFHQPALVVAFPEGRPLLISAVPRRGGTTLYIVEPPATEVREVSVALIRARTARWVDGGLQLRDRDGAIFAIDLATGTTTPAPAWAATSQEFGSFWSLAVSDDEARIHRSGLTWVLSASGGLRVEDEEEASARSSGCRCDDTTLRCGEEELALACTDVAELERIENPYEEGGDPSTFYSRRYRMDRLEPDLLRITRLSDGARLWVRLAQGGLFAQADDGACVLPEGEAEADWAVRWGRSLLEAPVTPLGRAAFERPTLIADFFAGRPLPAADTTMPSGPR